MTEDRKKEIAVVLLEHTGRRKFKPTFESFIRDLGNTAKEIGVPIEELKSLAKPIAQSVLDEAFK